MQYSFSLAVTFIQVCVLWFQIGQHFYNFDIAEAVDSHGSSLLVI